MSTLLTILTIIPMILKAVRELEGILPIAGIGPQKLAFLKEVVGTEVDPGIVEKIVNAAVKLFNTVGWPKQ